MPKKEATNCMRKILAGGRTATTYTTYRPGQVLVLLLVHVEVVGDPVLLRCDVRRRHRESRRGKKRKKKRKQSKVLKHRRRWKGTLLSERGGGRRRRTQEEGKDIKPRSVAQEGIQKARRT